MRLRCAQRLLIGAAAANMELLTCEHWQAAMEELSRMLKRMGKPAKASSIEIKCHFLKNI